MSDERPRVRVFFSYSHADDRHRIRLEKALKLLERQGLIDTWTDRKLLSTCKASLDNGGAIR